MAHPVARRYAEAYFQLAQEAGDIEGWREQLARAVETVSDPAATRVLTHPKLSRHEREQSAEELLDGVVSEPARNLMRLLISNGRLRLAPTVIKEYDELADAAAGIVRSEVLTALPVDEKVIADLTRRVRQRLGKDVRVEVKQDPSILGGLVIRVGDRVIDNSVRTHLQQLQTAVSG